MKNLLRAIFGLTIFLEEINELADLRDRNKELETEYNLSLDEINRLNKEINSRDVCFSLEVEKLKHEKSSLSKQVSTLDKKLNKKTIELESKIGKSCCSGDLCGITPNLLTIDDMTELYMKHFSSPAEPELSDNVAVYVDDLAGGKVIKQEANKCVKINKEGEVEEGYTRKRCDKGFNYKLIREK